ncbi:response regulator [Paenibacillus sp. LHD-38]|uniref:response regulator transcription factor n=1 Tax=Paenibacillus sp. LHD-38 TaxID=3072143 RepID=UPI00280EDAD6|nr:response regulator [Paenibacillus sp. LHD-38]MDQ8737913.1 response regulator [Paenibacillus sp. LHD-38]
MYRVLLVDDEKIARTGLRFTFEWEKHGFTLVGEASNGEKAMKWIKEQEIDILITDIAMPVMDGLELTRRTRELCPWVKVLLLSCHNDFEYVREGIRLGASDYILKPMLNASSLEEVLKKMSQELQEEHENRLILKRYEDQQQANRQRELEGILGKVFCGDGIAVGRLEKECPGVFYRVAALGINVFGETEAEMNQVLTEQGEALKLFLYQSLEAFVSVLFRPDLMVSVFPAHVDTYDIFSERIKQCSKHTDSTRLHLSVGLSGVNTDYHSLETACREAKNVLARGFFRGPCSYLTAEELHASMWAPNYPFAAALGELKESLSMGYASKSEKILEQMMNCWIPGYREKEEVIQEAEELLSLLVVFSEAESSIVRKIRELSRLGCVKDVMTYVKDCYLTIGSADDSLRPDKTRHQRIVIEAAAFIEKHFREPISLQQVADAVNVSKNYFSEMFKRVTGDNFIDYLISLRVKRAKELLQGSSLKVYEVAEQSGFNDVKHFSKQFKKLVGLSPAEFQGLCRKD